MSNNNANNIYNGYFDNYNGFYTNSNNFQSFNPNGSIILEFEYI